MTSISHKPNRRVLVVGAKFGELYLNAFMQPQPGLELAGLLANGSARAQQLAHAFGIPHYTAPDQVPDDIDIACVVVRATVVGGAGSTLAQDFLARGMHVVQEHPLHPDELVRLQRLAKKIGRCHWVNSFYPHTSAGRCWIATAQRVRRLLDGEPARFAHLCTSRQLLYSSLDLLLQASLAPHESAADLQVDAQNDHDPVFGSLRVQLPGCHAALRLQTDIDPADPDLHSLTMHQMTLGWPSGHLALAATHGPVVWTAALHDPGHREARQSLFRRAAASPAGHLAAPPALVLHPAAPDWRHAFEVDGPTGVGRVLQGLRSHLDGAAVPAGFDPDHQLALAQLWQRTLRSAGPAREGPLPAPRDIAAQELLAAASAS